MWRIRRDAYHKFALVYSNLEYKNTRKDTFP